MKKVYLLLLVCLGICGNARADVFSYLYIQGDKQTPFYVKMEDAMQPRYGKNYCIIPQLAPGPVHIEILFQQNIYPPQQFTILIPDGGNRSFLLVKKDSAYSLYDLQQGFYLAGGNKEEDDRMPPAAALPTAVQQQAVTPVETEPTVRQAEVIVPKEEAPVPPVAKKQENKGPEFIRDMELTKGDNRGTSSTPIERNTTERQTTASGVVITNSDCPAPLASADFSKIFNDVSALGTDEERLDYLNGKMDKCYATWQARTLAGRLTGDAARYSLLKKIYPRITDQAAFPLLDDLLTTDIWKAEFARIVHP